MSPEYMTHLVTRENGEQSLTYIFLDGNDPVTVNSDHPHFDALLDPVGNPGSLSAEDVRSLADLSVAVAQRFNHLSERVAVANGRVYFDGDQVDTAITRQIVRVLDTGAEDWRPLVRFMENLAANENAHSREQLFEWLRPRDFTITEEGHIVAYKGVAKDRDGNLVSVNRGPAVVNGESVNGAVPNPLGATVELARSQVNHDPAQGCSFGLHVGTYEYAKGWARGALLKVTVNPRDVVSVPTDCAAQKVRVCRYRVIETIDAPETAPVAYSDTTADLDDSFEDEEFCEDCGEYVDECDCCW